MHRKVQSMVMLTLLLAATTLHGADLWADSYRFFGRWDRRVANRAVTVNSGSYILARFTGTSLNATFDVSVKQPPFPTLVWRIDDGEWQEAKGAATVKLTEGLSQGFAYPKAKIAAVRPTCGAQADSIKAAVDACHAAGDTKIYYVDTTGWYKGDVHPNVAGSAMLAGKLVQALKTYVLPK